MSIYYIGTIILQFLACISFAVLVSNDFKNHEYTLGIMVARILGYGVIITAACILLIQLAKLL